MATYGNFTGKLEAINQMLSTIGASRINQPATAGEANDAQKILEEVDRAVQSEGWHFNKFYKVKLYRGMEELSGVTVSGTTVTTVTPHYLVKGETVKVGTTETTVASVTGTSGKVFEAKNAPAGGSPTTLTYTKRVGTPQTALGLDFSIYLSNRGVADPIIRGRFIYDKKENTYEFNSDVEVIVIYQIPFEQEELGGEALPEYARRFITMKAARLFAQRHIGDPQLVQMAQMDEREAWIQFLAAEADRGDDHIFQSPLAHYTISRGGSSNVSPIGSLYNT